MAAIPAEFVFFVGLFDFRWHHGLREGQRQRIAVVGRGLAALLHVGDLASRSLVAQDLRQLADQQNQGQMTYMRLHGIEPWKWHVRVDESAA
jgi:alpha-L-fucosidase